MGKIMTHVSAKENYQEKNIWGNIFNVNQKKLLTCEEIKKYFLVDCNDEIDNKKLMTLSDAQKVEGAVGYSLAIKCLNYGGFLTPSKVSISGVKINVSFDGEAPTTTELKTTLNLNKNQYKFLNNVYITEKGSINIDTENAEARIEFSNNSEAISTTDFTCTLNNTSYIITIGSLLDDGTITPPMTPGGGGATLPPASEDVNVILRIEINNEKSDNISIKLNKIKYKNINDSEFSKIQFRLANAYSKGKITIEHTIRNVTNGSNLIFKWDEPSFSDKNLVIGQWSRDSQTNDFSNGITITGGEILTGDQEYKLKINVLTGDEYVITLIASLLE
jgi:hypothetical protein